MGDAVELSLAIESAFDLEIPEKDAEQMRTPGDVADWVLPLLRQRMAPDETAPDIFAWSWERVHSLLSPLATSGITRETKLDDALPSAARARHLVWEQLDFGDFPLPPLQAPAFIETTTGILLYSLPFGILIGALQINKTAQWDFAPWFWILVLSFVILLAIMPRIMDRVKLLATRPPLRTVGELVDYLVLHNYWRRVSKRGSWSEDEAWRVLQKLIAQEAATSPDEVRRDSQFAELLMWD